MNYNAFKKIKAIENAYKRKLQAQFPTLTEESGIYIFTRTDEVTGIKYAYVGQAKHLLSRLAQHMAGRQSHIDRSLYNRGLAKDGGQWQLGFSYCAETELDERERENIQKAAQLSFQLYNKTSGGQGEGKAQLGDSEGVGGYRKGKAAGEAQLRRKVKEYFDKYLTVSVKEPTNKIKERKLEEFKNFIGDEEC